MSLTPNIKGINIFTIYTCSTLGTTSGSIFSRCCLKQHTYINFSKRTPSNSFFFSNAGNIHQFKLL